MLNGVGAESSRTSNRSWLGFRREQNGPGSVARVAAALALAYLRGRLTPPWPRLSARQADAAQAQALLRGGLSQTLQSRRG